MAAMTASCRTNNLDPDKGEVGGSCPPRPTIQITSKYGAILSFSLSGNISQEANLPTICQLYDWLDGTTLRPLKPIGWRPNGWDRLGYAEKAPVSRRRTWTAVQDNARPSKDWEGIFSQFAGAKFS